MNAVLHNNLILAEIYLLHLLYILLILFRLNFELKHSHIGSLFLVHIRQNISDVTA